MTGRARGRARGRSRVMQDQQGEESRRPGEESRQEGEGPRRPGEAPLDYAGSSSPQQEPPPLPPEALLHGRTTHRGGVRPRVGPAGEPLEAQMEGMSIRGGPGGRGGPPREGGQGRGGPPRERRERLTAADDEKVATREIDDKQGTSGTIVNILGNFFPIRHEAQEFQLYQYRVDFSPEVDSKRMRVMMVKNRQGFQNQTAFDGQTLFMARPAPETSYVATRPADNAEITVTINETNRLHVTDPQCLQMFNVIFRRTLFQNKMFEIGRHYFSPESRIVVPQHHVEIWPGFCTSIAEYDGGAMLCADVSHKLLRTLDVLGHIKQMYNENPDPGRLHEMCVRKLVGEIVLTKYNNRTYRIDDIDFDKTPQSTFSKADGTEIMYADYYKNQYNITIQDMGQPLLVSRPKARDRRAGMTHNFELIPELCLLTGITQKMRTDNRVMQDLAQHTRVNPQDRKYKLEGLVDMLTKNTESRAELTGWGLEFARSLIHIRGRKLEPERIIQPGCEMPCREDTADWSDRLKRCKLVQTINLDNWMMIFEQRERQLASDFFDVLRMVSRTLGVDVKTPELVPLPSSDVATYSNYLKSALDRNPSTQMVVCLVPNQAKDRYDAIKKICCIEMPVPSQIVLRNTIRDERKRASVATKIAIQLNAKMGGVAWTVPMPMKHTMIAGFDSYHDSSKRGQSVGAFVASYDSTCTKYYSKCLFQSGTQELHDGLKVCVMGALRKYQEENGRLPDRIVIYRDGVGDGQLAQVHNYEVPQIMEAFARHQPGYQPNFGVIVVKKRINTRLLWQPRDDQDLVKNPLPGTIVDTTVTKPQWYDFFLVSQSVRQGTVSPTHYNVIYDTMKLKPDNIQRLTYKMTHLYYNWPGTIRVPAPCQYAHKLAQLVGMHLHRSPHNSMTDTLFYL